MSQTPIQLPILRAGRVYESAEWVDVRDIRTGLILARVSQANPGLIRRDLRRASGAAKALRSWPMEKLLALASEAGRRFMEDELPLGPDQRQDPGEYVRTLSATSGLTHRMCRANMQKVAKICFEADKILGGLTRGLDLSIFDEGIGTQDGVDLCFFPVAEALGVILPSNSPGVNTLWIPAILLKTPVCLKPGREEPWTPWRIIQAFIASGFPPEAFSFYPTSHEGATEILKLCGRSLLFGGASAVEPWRNDPRIEIHGPGRSKFLIGPDAIGRWQEYLDLMVDSIVVNGGRSCINLSTIVVPSEGEAIAGALADRLGSIQGGPLDDDGVQISAFANPETAERIDQAIARGLEAGGARDLTAERRGGDGRLQKIEGATFLRPTVLLCDSIDHPLANVEYPFPFVAVVEVPSAEMVDAIGPTLVATAITDDAELRDALVCSPNVDRLNLGPVATTQIPWNQPHEGNLFEFLYRRRAIQVVSGK